MNRNPLIPFALIAFLGIGLMFLLSFVGLDNMDEMANEGHEGETTEAATPDQLYAQSCIACHGADLQGNIGPALANIGSKYDAAAIQNVILNGQGKMAPQNLNAEQAKSLAEWLAEKK